eukprot:CAMPEP_0182427738 /NCGR_PEP_ID=MMETSP1167-20130531/19069_1 /TAXON_ID=2988 /ORGANISM="Mallomonas Sp, Strain CCMP3275" /LENGTH=86 /DNA_ID=CAMNT_0024610181 /DNA_START=216 /DNA_END=476 /DNA_ORIENTATION=-
MTPMQRMELATRASCLEDEIFLLQARLQESETKMLNNIENASTSIQDIQEMRDELQGLKTDYIELVGAKDVPIYFGKIDGTPDSLQ